MPNAYHHLITRHLKEDRGERTAYRYQGSDISYAKLDEMAAAAAHILREAGLVRGDRVASFCGDSPSLVAFILGAWRIGAVVVVGNQLCPAKQLLSYCAEIEPGFVLVSELTEPLLQSRISGQIGLDSKFTQDLMDGPRFDEIVDLDSDEVSCWQYTQSPQGEELAVLHSHAAIIAGAEPFAVDRLKLNEDDICFSIAKLHFGFGFGNSLVFPLSVGACAILENARIDVHSVLATIQKEKATVCFAVPTFLASLVMVPDCETRYDLSSIRAWVSAGEELAPELYRDFTEKFSQAVINGIGSTEMFHIWVSQDLEDLQAGHLGQPCKGHEIRLLNAQNQEVKQGEVGAVWLRGPHNGLGYFNRPDKNQGKFVDGWIHSGDRMFQDSKGNYCFAGRSDEMVMVGGQKVVLAEVRDELSAHEWVKDVRIQAVRNEYRIHNLTAWVRLEQGIAPNRRTGRLLRKSLRETLLPHKCPTAFEFLPAYQRNLGIDVIDSKREAQSMTASVSEPIEWMLELRSLVDERLKTLLFDKLRRAELVSPVAPHLVDSIRDLTLRGGKRLRPALLVVGYISVCDESDLGRVIEAAVAAELLQTSLLIHDDWMDRDQTRRGGKSVHVEMAERYGDEHIGASVAMLAGSLASCYAWEALASSGFTGDCIRAALKAFWEIQEDVAVGQLLDLAKAGDLDTMHHLKTSSYTVRGPLQIGATLGGGSEEQIAALFRFADPVGLAFQLRDDLLGTYGHPTKTGKPAANDLKEGKKTALIDAAYDLANPEQLKELESILGKATASMKETERARKILEACGARAAVEARAARLMSEGITTLDNASGLREDGVQLLRGIAGFLMTRLS